MSLSRIGWAFAGLFLASAVHAQTTYSLSDVVIPTSLPNSFARSIDNAGNVLVVAYENTWQQQETWVIGPHGARLLLPLPGTTIDALQLADCGRAVGRCSRQNGVMLPTVWSPSGEPRQLRNLERLLPYQVGGAVDSNGARWIVGVSFVAFQPRPVVWIGDVLVPLDLPSGTNKGVANAINASNVIVGSAWFDSAPRAWIRQGLAAPVVIDLPAPLDAAELYAVNVQGVAIGSAWQAAGGGGGSYALRYDGTSTEILPPPTPWDEVTLWSINRDGVAVGFISDDPDFPIACTGDGSGFVAAVLQGDQIYDLEGLLDGSGAGWHVFHGIEVNNAGEIVCTADSPAGKTRACVLTPSPEGAPPVGAVTRNRAERAKALDPVVAAELTRRLAVRLGSRR